MYTHTMHTSVQKLIATYEIFLNKVMYPVTQSIEDVIVIAFKFQRVMTSKDLSAWFMFNFFEVLYVPRTEEHRLHICMQTRSRVLYSYLFISSKDETQKRKINKVDEPEIFGVIIDNTMMGTLPLGVSVLFHFIWNKIL